MILKKQVKHTYVSMLERDDEVPTEEGQGLSPWELHGTAYQLRTVCLWTAEGERGKEGGREGGGGEEGERERVPPNLTH